MTRVAMLTTSLARGGAEVQAATLARSLAGRGWEVRAMALTQPGALAEELRAAGIATGPHGLARLVPALARFQPHILHAHLFHANLAARLARLVCPVPVVISTIHSLAESSRRSAHIARRDFAYRATDWLADATVCVSAAVAERHRAAGAVSAKRLRVIPNGVDRASFRPDAGLRQRTRAELGLQDGFAWLAAGRLMWKKNYPAMLEAMAKLGGGVLLIAGEGPDEADLRARAAALGVDARFLGARRDMPALMNAADGLVLSSAVEGLPMVLLEAAACGLPQVATAVGGVEEAVLHERTGWLAPAGDPAALAAAMARLVNLPPAAREAMARAAREHAARFDLALAASRWEALYGELLQSARRRGMEP